MSLSPHGQGHEPAAARIASGALALDVAAGRPSRAVLVDPAQPSGRVAVRRALPPMSVPVGRQGELAFLRENLVSFTPVVVHAPCGYGVSTLLRWVATTPGVGIAADHAYVAVGECTLEDLLRRLVLELFIDLPGRIATPHQCRALLAPITSVVVLDDLRCDPTVLDALVSLMPNACFVVGTLTPPPPMDDVATLAVRGLSDEAALEVLAASGRRLDPHLARELARAVYGRPLHLRQAAALLREGRHTLPGLLAIARRDPWELDRLSIGALSDAQRRVLTVLALLGGACVPNELVTMISGVREVRGVLRTLRDRGLAEDRLDRFLLPVCVTDRFRSMLLPKVEIGAALRPVIDALAARRPPEAMDLADLGLSALGLTAERRDWAAVQALVRVLTPVLVAAGRWDDAERALNEWAEAARHLGEPVQEALALHERGLVNGLRGEFGRGIQDLLAAQDRWAAAGEGAAAAIAAANAEALDAMAGGPAGPPRGGTAVVARRLLAVLVVAASAGIGAGAVAAQGLGRTDAGGNGSAPAATVTALVTPGTTPRTPGPSFTTPRPRGAITPTAKVSTPTPSTPSPSVTTPSPPTSLTPLALEVEDADMGKGRLSGAVVPRRVVTVTNRNEQDVTITGATLPEPFAVIADKCEGALGPAQSCELTVEFKPTQIGPARGDLVVSTAEADDATLTLTGTGTVLVTLKVTALPGIDISPGRVTDASGALSCPSTCTLEVDYSDPLTLTARPMVNGSKVPTPFAGWSGCTPQEAPGDEPGFMRRACVVDPTASTEDLEVTAAYASPPGPR